MRSMKLALALLASVPTLLIAQQAKPAPTRTAPPPTNVVLPPPDFHFKGNVGRTISESDPPQFPQPA